LWTLLAASLLTLIATRAHDWYFDPRRTNPKGHVVLYSTRWCPACERLRQCLRRHGVAFDERDVERSPRARSEWSVLDGYGVPLTLVGQRIAYGLRPDELRAALGEAGYEVDCGAPGTLPGLPSSALRR
jgi:glutaredoxin